MATYIARCRTCQIATSTQAFRLDRASAVMGALVYDRAGESGVYNGLAMPCRGCGKLKMVKAVKAKLSPTHICNAKCETSKGFQCECSCGGKNHGKAFAA